MTLQFRNSESEHATIAVFLEPVFDCYHKWLGIPPAEQPPTHYRLLGLENFESDTDAVRNAADARMAHVKTFQNGRHALLSQRLLNEIAAARACLLDHEQKAAYDRQLAASLTPRKPPIVRRVAPEPAKPPVQSKPAPAPAVDVPIVTTEPRTITNRGRRRRRASIGWSGWFVVALVTLAATILGTTAVVAAYWFLLRPQEPPVANRLSSVPVARLVDSP